ncbi:MAG: hypothetical protein JW951_08580, partial [Lentisphaerae bacterium]|nr:hypothetical protein [Lentisphaerota bacterium]
IDDVQRLPRAKPRVRRDREGYFLTAAVPLADLGLAGVPRALRGDAGVIYGDATGRDRDQRLYYYNRTTTHISDLTTEATLEPHQWGPVVFGLPGNLTRNAGFEDALREDDANRNNWAVTRRVNGAAAECVTSPVFAGRRALRLEQRRPVTLPAAGDGSDSAAEYYARLNDGQGGGFVLVGQTVPVNGGRDYNLGFAYRATGLVPERRDGPPGYAAFAVWLFWRHADGSWSHTWAFSANVDQPDWRRVVNPRVRQAEIEGLPYTAPAEATHVQIRLQLTTRTAARPRVVVDQVEFAPAAPNARGQESASSPSDR